MTSYDYQRQMTKFAEKYRHHDGKTAAMHGPILPSENARQHTTSHAKNSLSINFDVLLHARYSSDMASNDFSLLRSLQHFLVKICFQMPSG